MIKNEMFTTIFKNYKEEFEKLYKDESACLLIFRILPKQSQEIIMRIINIDESLNATNQDFLNKINWQDFLDEKGKDINKSALSTIKILTSENFVKLDSNFKLNLKKIIKEGISVKSEFILKSKHKTWNQCYEKGMVALEKYLTAIKSLDTYQESIKYDNEKYKFLINSGFIKKDLEESGRLTPFGLAFLLDDIQTQLRTLMVRFVLTIIHETNKKRELEFFYNLFKLCTLEIGVPYSTSYFEDEFVRYLEDSFRHFGIVIVKRLKTNVKRFYVTPLVKCIFEDMNFIFESQQNNKFLIIETNFKVFAYTNSQFDFAMIEFLCEIEYVFPNFIVAHVTRKSIRNALKRGISSGKSNTYNIPENIAQQISIWEEEKNALNYEKDDRQFQFYKVKFTQNRIAILYENAEKKQMIISNNEKTKSILKELDSQENRTK